MIKCGEIFDDDFYELWVFNENRDFSYKKVSISDILNLVLDSKSVLWGFAPISPIHFFYDKIFYHLKSLQTLKNLEVKILSADMYAAMSHGLSLEGVKKRFNYYKFYIERIWDIEAYFIQASRYFYNIKYQDMLCYTLSKLKSNKIKKISWSSWQKKENLAYFYIYPVMQNLDVLYLKPDIVFAEKSQMKIYKLLQEIASIFEFDRSVIFVFMNQSVDLKRQPITRSRWKDRLSIHESPFSLYKKLKICACPPEIKDNPLLELIEFSILPFKDELGIDIVIEDDGKIISFNTRKDLRSSILNGVRLLPKHLDKIAEWFNVRIKDINSRYYEEAPHLLEWIDMDKIRNWGVKK